MASTYEACKSKSNPPFQIVTAVVVVTMAALLSVDSSQMLDEVMVAAVAVVEKSPSLDAVVAA